MDSRQQLQRMNQMARQLVEQGQFAQALKIVEQMLAIAPGENLRIQRGILLMRLEHWQQAINAFVEVLKYNPGSQIARENLMQARSRLQNQSDATQSVGTNPDTITAFDSQLPQARTSPSQLQTDQRLPAHRRQGQPTVKRGLTGKFIQVASGDSQPQTFGRYQIIKELGCGGMGKVFHAYDASLKRNVALKTILQSNDTVAIQRFSREAEAMARLSHPNIVKIYDVGVIDEVYYFTMELIRGLSLSDWIAAERLTVRRAVMVLHKVTEAIDYAHQQGIIHRDLKPGNIIINEEGEPFVMDFGLARETQGSDAGLSKSGMPLGTLKYMPPEQAMGEKREIDERSDVYALGAVLYELLTGRAPFQGTTTHVILLKILEEEPIAPRELSKKIPAELEAICLKAMAKDKRRRYQSAHELSRDLERFLNGEPVLASTPSLGYQLQKWIGKNRLLAASILLAVAIVVTGVIVLLIFGEMQKRELKKMAMNALAAKDAAQREAGQIQEWARQQRQAAEKIKTSAVAQMMQVKKDSAQKLIETHIEMAESARKEFLYQEACRQYGWAIVKGEQAGVSNTLTQFARQQLDYYYPKIWELTPLRPGGIVYTIALTSDGKTLVSGGSQIVIWNLASQKVIKTIAIDKLLQLPPDQAHKNLVPVHLVAISPNSRFLAAAISTKYYGARRQEKNFIGLWDLHQERQYACLIGHANNKTIKALAFSPDSKVLASGSRDQTIWLWHVASAKPIGYFRESSEIYALDFSGDGNILVSGDNDGQIALWDMKKAKAWLRQAKGKERPTPPQIPGARQDKLSGHSGTVNRVLFSRQGDLLVSLSNDSTVRLYDSQRLIDKNSRLITRSVYSSLSGEIISATFDPQGKIIFCGDQSGMVQLLTTNGKITEKIKMPGGLVNALGYSAATKMLISLNGKSCEEIYLWKRGRPRQPRVLSETGEILALAVSPDNKTLAAGGRDAKIHLWDIASYQLKTTLYLLKYQANKALSQLKLFSRRPGVTALAFAADGKTLYSGDAKGEIIAWNLKTARRNFLYKHQHGIQCMTINTSKGILASASTSATPKNQRAQPSPNLSIWDIHCKRIIFSEYSRQVAAIAFTSDGELMATGEADCLRLWNVATKKSVWRETGLCCHAVAFASDNQTLAVANGSRIFFWHLTTSGKEIKLERKQSPQSEPYLESRHGLVHYLVFFGSGNTLASVGADSVVRLWSPATWRLRGELFGHSQAIRVLAFSADNHILASAGDDQTVCLWDTAPSTENFSTQTWPKIQQWLNGAGQFFIIKRRKK